MRNTFLTIMLVACSLCTVTKVQAAYFKDDFSWGFNANLWSARSGDNGSPFGCTFAPGMISPSSHGITLALSQGSCSELQSRSSYHYGKVQGALKTGNTPGTVASIFTYTSWWDAPGRAWQEIDIEFLPSLGNVVHTNVIYQPQGGTYQSWEQDIDLGQYGLNIQQNLLTIGFDWRQNYIRWYVFDASGNEQTLRTVYKDNGDSYLASDEIPAYAWPVDNTKIMINHWHGDNSQDGFYFPGQYFGGNGWAYYDFIEYIPH
ncbi:family 16 glycosylhydrolase [Shewanella sp. CG12_big_fil_rev_8_21_14_0_65_47_15]|uniref:family 16 glycosylhydrolase n=1 Tax=Shewanella sp. CG12_big_fil_rev_8_21_14_0_65_47_15 TaxID=1975537 RepID=UPI000CB7ED6D|nr:family 16 glycosylhydrolase [Shewanella sp. CG12_big_fil_rev_8_21_14_0_65_47_15]PIW62661.1 MAG: beta-glucanase [Shewanella sp. CG12_big_fil_rev_8_21_14_0_65_47_15]